MLLASSLEPAGPKSKSHYIILHHDKLHNLIKLPKSYPDLQKEVQKLYHVEANRFHIESKELNLCAGERIRIPADAWSDISELLGNVFIVPFGDGDVLDSHPESGPETSSPPTQATPIDVTQKGVINLQSPFVRDEVIVINLGKFVFQPGSEPSTLKFNVLDDAKNSVLAVGYSPPTPTEATPSNVEILIHKQETHFLVLFDSNPALTFNVPSHAPLTSVAYDFGTQSTFKAAISANVYPSLSHFHAASGPSHTAPLTMNKETLFQQILASDPQNAASVRKALDEVRKEQNTFKHSNSGASWRSCGDFQRGTYTALDWKLPSQSAFVVRYTLAAVPSGRLDLHFHNGSLGFVLQIDMHPTNTIKFYEHNAEKAFEEYHTISLSHSMHAAGDHSVALIHHAGKIHVSFDFKQSTVLPRTTLFSRQPDKILISLGDTGQAEADFYGFGS